MINKEFNKWLKKKTVTYKTIEELCAIEAHHTIISIKTLYLLYQWYEESGLFDLDYITVAYVEETNEYYLRISNYSIEVGDLFGMIATRNFIEEISNLSNETLLRACALYKKDTHVLLPLRDESEINDLFTVPVDYDKDYYYMISINPYCDDPTFIRSFEKSILKYGIDHGKINDVLTDIINKMIENKEFLNLAAHVNQDFVILVFESAEDRKHFIVNRDRDSSKSTDDELPPDEVISGLSKDLEDLYNTIAMGVLPSSGKTILN